MIAFPFLHTAWLLSAAAGAVVVTNLLPPRPWRIPAAVLAGAIAAAILASLGVVPWFGTLHLAAYGVFMLLAFVVAYILTVPRARLVGIEEREIIDCFLIALIAGLAGARARYVWERSHDFLFDAQGHRRAWTSSFAQMVDFDGGGMVWYGGFSLAALCIVIFIWRRRIRILAMSDVIAPALLGGLAVGRIGCSVNGCCYGRPTDGAETFLPFAMHHAGHAVYPTQVYESIACTLMAVILWFAWRRRRVDGAITLCAVLGYACWRFFNETLRGDDKIDSNLLSVPQTPPTVLFGVKIDTSMATSVQMVVIGLVVTALVLWYRSRHPSAQLLAHQVPGSRYGAPTPLMPAQPAPSPA